MTTKTPGTEIKLPSTASPELVEWASTNRPEKDVLQLVLKMDLESTLDSSGVNPAVLNIMSKILTADTEEALFAAANAGTTAGKDFLGIPFQFMWNDESGQPKTELKRSAAVFREQGGFPYYYLMTVMNTQTGEELIVNCGGYTFMSVAWKLHDTGWINDYKLSGPKALILEGKPAPNGTVVLAKPFKMPTANGPQKA